MGLRLHSSYRISVSSNSKSIHREQVQIAFRVRNATNPTLTIRAEVKWLVWKFVIANFIVRKTLFHSYRNNKKQTELESCREVEGQVCTNDYVDRIEEAE